MKMIAMCAIAIVLGGCSTSSVLCTARTVSAQAMHGVGSGAVQGFKAVAAAGCHHPDSCGVAALVFSSVGAVGGGVQGIEEGIVRSERECGDGKGEH